ncbi:MAG TPA: hypothetical protein VNT60_05860, partial [Deinococcales bacterium]|nr:hypothetical protein [Deinococcales bacterium]
HQPARRPPASRGEGVSLVPAGYAAAAPQLTVRTGATSDERFVPEARRAWQQAARDLSAIGLDLPAATLVAYRDAAAFRRATGRDSGVAAVTAAGTIHTQRLGALADRGILTLTVRHEAFHLAQPPRLPLWLAEGLARVFSGEQARDTGPTGLEGLDAAGLERELVLGGPRLLRAYREAGRRAARLIEASGWAGVLRPYR